MYLLKLYYIDRKVHKKRPQQDLFLSKVPIFELFKKNYEHY